MPWNDNANPGPWGAPSGGEEQADEPARRRPPSPPPTPPDLAEVLRRLRAEWTRRWRGLDVGRIGGRAFALGAGALAVAWALSGAYLVEPYQKALVSRLGVFDRIEGPGLHWRLPLPFERADVLDVGHLRKTVVGGGADEGQMLTRDEEVVDLAASVDWRIADPAAFAFHIADGEGAVQAAAESALRTAVGRREAMALLTGDRASVEAEARAGAQRVLDAIHAGVTVTAVRVDSVAPPEELDAAWQDVAHAGQEARAAVDEADAYAARRAAETAAAAARQDSDAAAYQQRVVHEANGEASRFDQLLIQYRRAPAVIREQLYLQTMRRILAQARVVVVDGKGGQVVLAAPVPIAPKPPEAGK